MTAQGEAPLPFAPSDCRAVGWIAPFFLAKILPPEAAIRCDMHLRLHDQSALEISSFMISLVPP